MNEAARRCWITIDATVVFLVTDHGFINDLKNVTMMVLQPELQHDPHCDEIRQFDIYTDGSARETPSTWVIVITSTTYGHGTFHYGYCCGPTHYVLGVSNDSNNVAEALATLVAFLWTIQSGFVLPVIVHTDSRLVVDAVMAKTRPQSNSRLIHTAMAPFRMCQCMNTRTQLVHVYGHTGNPWNEFADRAAEHARSTPTILFQEHVLYHDDVGKMIQWTMASMFGASNMPAKQPLHVAPSRIVKWHAPQPTAPVVRH